MLIDKAPERLGRETVGYPNRMAAPRAKDLDDILGIALTNLKPDGVGPERHYPVGVLGNDMG